MEPVIEIRSLEDNFIWLYPYGQEKAIVIDPADAKAVIKAITKRQLSLTAILVTHHHWDHVGGIEEIKKLTGCKVIAADSRTAAIDKLVTDGDIIDLGEVSLKVIATPGHTKNSVCYYLPASGKNKPILWTGDTLFIGGCGKVFETNMTTMWNSLKKLASLPKDTIVCPGHDYTEENYEFALTIEPENDLIKKALGQIYRKKPVFSTIGDELKTNVFLQAKTDQAFTKLRQAKDVF